MKFSRQEISKKPAASLVWAGNTLVDWVGGGAVFHLDGRREDPRVRWAFSFDAVRATADGRFAVIYQRLGTKALLLREGKLLRELNRSFYHADVYEYPICIWKALDGRTLIAHCPEDYNRIDIDDADSGTRLTGGVRKPADFFHSRLMVNADGTRLLSAGWVWHPWSSVVYYDVGEALRDPAHLDDLGNCAPGSRNVGLAEEDSACWQTTERVLLGGSPEEDIRDDEDTEEMPGPRLHARGIAVYDLTSQTYITSATLGEAPGTLMPIGETHAICFYGHPKLVSLDSGQIVMRWEDINTGKQTSSILSNSHIPPIAIDVEHHRFAVSGPNGINVVQIDLSE